MMMSSLKTGEEGRGLRGTFCGIGYAGPESCRHEVPR